MCAPVWSEFFFNLFALLIGSFGVVYVHGQCKDERFQKIEA